MGPSLTIIAAVKRYRTVKAIRYRTKKDICLVINED